MAEVNGIKSLCIALLVAGIVTQTGSLGAQEVKHLNPVIEKLAAGKPFIGFQTGDLSFQNARTMARADADYVYVDMEHTPMDFPALHQFSIGMVDKATALKKGNAQPNVALFAPTEALYAAFKREVTTDRVKQLFGRFVKGRVDRYEVPNLRALNFVIENALGGGVTRSLRQDMHGKSLSSLMLTIELPGHNEETQQAGGSPRE